MSYLYETHMHTCQGSACGVSTGAEQARFYKEQGYTGIFVTDHFTGGNTAVPRDLPWRERVEWFCSGYEDALIEGQKIGLDVFFGWEQNYEGDEYLIYGPDKAWLLAHPDVEHYSRARQLEEVHRAGGAVIQAHPFRHRDYIKYILLGLKYCDGIEVANTGNTADCDAYALRYARAYDLLTTAGSDNHNNAKANPAMLMGVETQERLGGPLDFARLIRARGAIRPVVPEGRFDVDPAEAPSLASYWIDEDDRGLHRVPTRRDFLRE
ncbi:MAG: PHP domain-containing protein [Clostridia bacterium]|nr:PHP domain-containing protein [Clostridia bacterium]